MPRYYDPNNPPAFVSSSVSGTEASKSHLEKRETSQSQQKTPSKENHLNGYTLGDNEGKLFLAKKSNTNKRQPNMRGTINIDGTLYDLSGWFHMMKNGQQQFIALRAKKQHKDKGELLSTRLNGKPYFDSGDKAENK